MTDPTSVDEYLLTAHDMLALTYPEGIREEDYMPVLAILGERMPHRSVRDTVAPFVERDAGIILNDIYGALSELEPGPSPSELVRVREKLHRPSVQAWAKQWEHLADDKGLYR